MNLLGWFDGREVGNFVGTGFGDGFDVCFVGFEDGCDDGRWLGRLDGWLVGEDAPWIPVNNVMNTHQNTHCIVFLRYMLALPFLIDNRIFSVDNLIVWGLCIPLLISMSTRTKKSDVLTVRCGNAIFLFSLMKRRIFKIFKRRNATKLQNTTSQWLKKFQSSPNKVEITRYCVCVKHLALLYFSKSICFYFGGDDSLFSTFPSPIFVQDGDYSCDGGVTT